MSLAGTPRFSTASRVAAPAARPVHGVSAALSARALWFTGAMLAACLLLQRFGLPFGGKAVSVVGPVGLALAGFEVARGTLILHRFRLASYLVLAICVLAGLAWHALQPGGGVGGGTNLQSMSQFLLLVALAVLTFAEPVEEGAFFRRVNFWFAVIAVAGAIQFAAQFVGVRIFAFTGLLPDSLLFEAGYNQQIPVGVGELLKSNGFFLVEPSIFSQVMALALIIEILAFQRLGYLALFMAGLLLSFSGTGWIVMFSFVAAAALGMGWRGVMISMATVILIGTLLGVAAHLVPDVADALHARFDEISRPGTSGHLRFITPFWALDDSLSTDPAAAIVGLGSGVSERLSLPYEYALNTPVKVILDYGFPALIAYVLLFVGGRRSPVQAGILVPTCTLFFFTGGYQQFPPVLFLVLLLTSVARLQPAATPGSRASARAIASR